MKNLGKKAITKTLKAAFLTAIILTVFLTAIGDVYGKESDVSRDIPMVRSIANDVPEKNEEISSRITHDESVEPQRAFCMSDEPDNNANDALQGSTSTYFYVEPNGRITMLSSSPQVSSSTDETSHDIVEYGEISGYESGSRDGPVSPGPDLLFTDIWTSPAPPVGDSSATIYFRLENIGTTTGTTFRNEFYIAGVGTWSATKNGMTGGTYLDYNLGVTLPPGTYEITAIADVWDQVTEDDETNNEYSESIMWEGPDLVFIDIYTDPDPPVGGQEVTLIFRLKNQGTMDAVGEFTSNFFIDGVYVGAGVNDGLAAGAEFVWGGYYTLTPGWHHLAAEADSHSQIVESDETNNERFERIWWNGSDLIVEDIWIAGSYITAGQPFNLDFRIKNIGDNASGWFHTRVYIDDVYRYYGNDAGLSAGESRWWRNWNVWLTSGWHTVEIKADYYNNVTETCEDNNNRTESFYSYKAKWTILVYLDGDNNLEGYFINHFLEMAMVGSYRHMSIVVQMDRTPGYDTRYDDWTDCNRFFVKTGTTPTAGNALQNLGEVNMGDDQTLINFATWGINRFEADYYLLNPADHGGSWVGCCWDDTSGGDKLTSAELKNALSSIKEELGRNLDVIWWDDCLMNSIEVAAQVYPYVDYMAGSETVSWTHTWDYNPIITALRNWPPPTPQELAIDITDLGTPRDSASMRTQSMSSIDLSKVADLVSTVNSFSKELKNNLYQYRTEIENARSASDWYEGPYSGDIERLIDLYQFAYKIKYYVPDSTIDSLADSIMNKIGPSGGAIGKVVVKEDHSASASFCHGLGIYFPLIYANYSSSYTDGTDFTADTQWDEFLQWYYTVSKPCLVIRGGDNKIYYRVRGEGAWTGLSSVPGSTNDAPAAVVLANKLHIAVVGTDGKIYHGYVDLYSGAWSGWTLVPGSTPSPPTLAAYGNRLYLLVRGMDNRIYLKYWEAGSWSTWHQFATGTTCDSPAAVGQDNKIHVVVRGMTGGLYYSYLYIPTWSYSGWSSIPGDTPSRPALTTDDSKLYLVVRGNNDRIYYNIFDGTWDSWTQVPGATEIGPGAACFEGKLNIVVRGVPSGLYHGAVDLSTLDWLGWTSLPGDTPSQPALTRPS